MCTGQMLVRHSEYKSWLKSIYVYHGMIFAAAAAAVMTMLIHVFTQICARERFFSLSLLAFLCLLHKCVFFVGFFESYCIRYVCHFFCCQTDFILGCTFSLISCHSFSPPPPLLIRYYHLNINVVGYNSVEFIIQCSASCTRTGHNAGQFMFYALTAAHNVHACIRVCMRACCLCTHTVYTFSCILTIAFDGACSCIYIHSNYVPRTKMPETFRCTAAE